MVSDRTRRWLIGVASSVPSEVWSLVLVLLTAAYALLFRRISTSQVVQPSGATGIDELVFSSTGGLLIAGAVLTAVCCRSTQWILIDPTRVLRSLLFPTLIVLAFAFSTTHENFFLGSWFGCDRIALVLALLLTIWRPAFLGLAVLAIAVRLFTLAQPLSLSWTDKALPIDLLLLSNLFVLAAVTARVEVTAYVRSFLAILAVFYLRPGIAKIDIGWFSGNRLDHLYRGAFYQNGWDGLVGPFNVDWLSGWIAFVSPPLMLATLLVELVPILFLFSRKLLVVFLMAAVLMHAGIFASSGIFFWKWMLVDLFVLASFLRLRKEPGWVAFGARQGVGFSLLCFIGIFLYLPAPKLAWFDSNVVHRYRVEATTPSGEKFQIPPRHFAPFDLQFAQARFSFLSDCVPLVDCFGACSNREAMIRANEILTPIDLREHYDTAGEPVSNDERKNDFLVLLERFLVDANAHRGEPISLSPWHIWTGALPGSDIPVWDGTTTIETLTVFRESINHAGKAVLLESRPVASVRRETPSE